MKYENFQNNRSKRDGVERSEEKLAYVIILEHLTTSHEGKLIVKCLSLAYWFRGQFPPPLPTLKSPEAPTEQTYFSRPHHKHDHQQRRFSSLSPTSERTRYPRRHCILHFGRVHALNLCGASECSCATRIFSFSTSSSGSTCGCTNRYGCKNCDYHICRWEASDCDGIRTPWIFGNRNGSTKLCTTA